MSAELVNRVKTSFKETFKTDPIMFFSPGRINLIGEHTDYNDGFVLPAAINLGIVVAIQKSENENTTVFAIDKNQKIKLSSNDIEPSAEGNWIDYIKGIVAELLIVGKNIDNFNLAFGGDIPLGAGMSSSAALENSLVFGLNELFDLGLSKEEMILISQKAEHNYVGVKCGIMDQYASMFGIKDNALLLDCRSIQAKPYHINFKDYELVLINTNVKHDLSDSAYNDRRSVCESVSDMLKVTALRDVTEYDLERIKDKVTPENYQKALYVIQENSRVIKASKAIETNDLEKLGELFYESHLGLKNQYKVSCEELDFLVTLTTQNKHILGSRMMGGGFGGCTINLIAKEYAKEFISEVSKVYKNKFKKECSTYFIELSDGTKIVS